MNTTLNRSTLRSRYFFAGTLVLDTALHIGGGRESSTVTDGPIVRDSLGRPLIPGSSMKGAFRASVERLVPNLAGLGFRTCQLVDGFADCLSTYSERGLTEAQKRSTTRKPTREDYAHISEAVGRRFLNAAEDGAVLQRLGRTEWLEKMPTEEHLLDLLAEFLCDTCQTFGAVHLAAVARFHDLPVQKPWAETTQIRDGVGIDRDSERAMDQIKFDYEVVPAQTAFEFKLTVENPTPHDLGLIALGLQEFVQGMIPLGGIRSRGLGRCHLQAVTVAILDFSNPASLKAYLTQPDWLKKAAKPMGDFIAQQLTALLTPAGGNHA